MESKISYKIREVRKRAGLTQEEFGKKFGVEKITIIRYEKGDTLPDYKFLSAFLREFKVSPNELFEENLTPPWQSIQPIIHLVGPLEKAPDPKKVRIEDYYAAPLVEGKIAAGPGRIGAEEIKSLVWIYSPELRARKNHQLVALQLAKDATSMKPTLEPGDIVLIDRDDPHGASDFISGKIYAVRMGRNDEGCAVKRLHADSGGLIISSDNTKDFPPQRAWTADLQKLIVGRVVWGWRNLLEA